MSITIYTIPELVPILRMKPRAIRKLFKNGELLARFVGRQWLVTEDDLRSFLEDEGPAMEEPEQQQLAIKAELEQMKRKLQILQGKA